MRSFPVTMRVVPVVIVLLALCAAPAAALSGTPTPVPPLNRVGLVVRYGDGSYVTRCVAFAESALFGDELLARSGHSFVMEGSGSICAIDGQGCPADDCFCGCPFPQCEYWGYYHLENGRWRYSDVGASFYEVMNGDVDGWSWGPGNFSEGVPPPVIMFDEICAGPAPTVTPSPTATLWPTATPIPTPTPTPTPAPLPPAEIPEPSALLLAASGLVGLGAWVRGLRRRH